MKLTFFAPTSFANHIGRTHADCGIHWKSTDIDVLWNRATYTVAKYGVCQGRAKQDSCSWCGTNGVLTQKEDKSALHAAVKRPCYTFVAEIFNETDQYRKSINSAWWNIFIRQNRELVCFVKREIRRTHVSLLEKIMKTNNRLQLHNSHPFWSALDLLAN